MFINRDGGLEKVSEGLYKKYCCGCGLCEAIKVAELKEDDAGFLFPEETKTEFNDFCRSVCPASGYQMKEYSKNIWGKLNSICLAYATDEKLRFEASSGGAITAICCYLLEHNVVDGIIQVMADPQNPIGTISVCSTTCDELKSRCGSRYTSSSPLRNIFSLLSNGKTYAFVGKPCDVTVLRNFAEQNNTIKKCIKVYISFFCAGAPSKYANIELLKQLGTNIDSCITLKYRGNGWPGYATAVDDKNNIYKMEYEKAWGKILGRDIRPICRFCADGIGEMADISCGDAWYLDEMEKPTFQEGTGRNVVFARTLIGDEIVKSAEKEGYIKTEEYSDWKYQLDHIQKYQWQRRSSMKDTVLAMRLFGKMVPKYDDKILSAYAKEAGGKERFKRFAGTVKRIMKGKIH